jgi:hypothetical protein
MSIRSCLVPAVVLSVNLCAATLATGEEGDIFTGPQAIEEDVADAGHPSRPKGALEKGGEPLGETAPLNGDRAASTAQNQSSRPESVRITRVIRQQIIDREDLSTAAKNVKVITDDKGAVTLRGPVKSSTEREAIEQIARNNAQGGEVSNQLVVKGEDASGGGAHG